MSNNKISFKQFLEGLDFNFDALDDEGDDQENIDLGAKKLDKSKKEFSPNKKDLIDAKHKEIVARQAALRSNTSGM